MKEKTRPSGKKQVHSPVFDRIVKAFEQISAIPRASRKEERIREWLVAWAQKKGFTHRIDGVGNLLIEVPGSAKREQETPVLIQGHLDMVCEKTAASTHDFDRDPIRFVYDGDWLRADQTSLGADNGIAIAIAMVLAESADVKHPPLELLFTVDEETGLTGARGLQADFYAGKTLINLDSEDEGVFTIGCAGGRDAHLGLPLEYASVPTGFIPFLVKTGGMVGGHSGVNIHLERANALIVLVRTLRSLVAETDLRIIGIAAGTAHNAIPRNAQATVYLPEYAASQLPERLTQMEKVFRSEFRTTDPGLFLHAEGFNQAADDRAMTEATSRRVIDLLLALPHGVAAWSTELEDLVETSSNLAKAYVDHGHLEVLLSQRSSVMSRLQAITDRIASVAALAGASCQSGTGYPAWQPDASSPLLAKAKKIYQKLFDREPRVEAIHAGLECGLIGSLTPGMQMLSLGCTLKDPHSPDERLYLPSIPKVWEFLVELLKQIP